MRGRRYGKIEEKGRSTRRCLFLADQSYPALIPSHGGQQFVKIICVENGTTQSLTSEFLNIGRG
jgi:hypothetical protein